MLFDAKGNLLPPNMQPSKYLHKWPSPKDLQAGKPAPTRSSKGSPPGLAPTPANKRKHFKSLGVKKHAMKTAPRKAKTVPRAAAAAKANAKAGATAKAGSTAKAGAKANGKAKGKAKAAPLTKDLKTVPPHTGTKYDERGPCSRCRFPGFGKWDDKDIDEDGRVVCWPCRKGFISGRAVDAQIRLNEARPLPLRIGITFPCGIRCGMSEISVTVPSPMRALNAGALFSY